MNVTASNQPFSFESFVNGDPTRLAFDEAHKLVWTLCIGWVLRLGLYRYKVKEYQDQVKLNRKELTAPVLAFARKLHQQEYYPVVAGDFRTSLANPYPPNRNTFSAWAARWRVNVYQAIPEKLRQKKAPFERVPVPSRQDEPSFSYQMKQGVTWVMIVDLDQELRLRGVSFDWTQFLNPLPQQGAE